MATEADKLDALRKMILGAFPKSVPPPPENLITHQCQECFSVRDDFTGVRWWSAKNDLIDENFDDMPLFSAEAFHYFCRLSCFAH